MTGLQAQILEDLKDKSQSMTQIAHKNGCCQSYVSYVRQMYVLGITRRYDQFKVPGKSVNSRSLLKKPIRKSCTGPLCYQIPNHSFLTRDPKRRYCDRCRTIQNRISAYTEDYPVVNRGA